MGAERSTFTAAATNRSLQRLRPHLWLLPLSVCLVGILTAGRFYSPKDTSTPYHLLQADAFLAGRLDIEPREYTYDLAFHNGKWFTYWGYVPALTLVPFRWALGTRLTDRDVAIALDLLSMFVWYLIARRLPSRGLPPLAQWEVVVLTFYCSFGQLTFNLSKSPVAAYTNHLFSFLFLSLCVLCLLRPTRGRVLASMAMFCLACLTRISLFVVAPIFLMMMLAYMHGGWRFWTSRAMLAVGITMGALIGIAISLHLFTNYIRFGSVLTFGTALMPANFPIAPSYSSDYVAKNVWICLVSPVQYSFTRPFVKGVGVGNAIWSYQFGILIPLLAIAWRGLAGRRSILEMDESERRRNVILIGGLVTIWVTYFLMLLFYRFSGEVSFGGRYLLDTQPFLLLVIMMSYSTVRKQPGLRFVSVTCLLVTGLVHIVSPQMVR